MVMAMVMNVMVMDVMDVMFSVKHQMKLQMNFNTGFHLDDALCFGPDDLCCLLCSQLELASVVSERCIRRPPFSGE